jgi:thioredoxin 1
LIKDSPALAVDFWSPGCPPCRRIKPRFEAMAKANDNDNLKFAAVNTQNCHDCAKEFSISSIPQFNFYVGGKMVNTFKGAHDDKLASAVAEISEQVMTGVAKHKDLSFQQFKPMNLAPQGFTSMGAIEKMKEFVLNFVKSEDTLKEVKSTQNLQNWLNVFRLENMPREAIDELMELVEIAEDKNKIALIDLIRLLMLHEGNAAHILNRHWQSFEVSIFGYVQCMDIKDPEAKVIQNYHLICLKMLGNIYQTQSGKDFMQSEDMSKALMDFCTFSIDSVNAKVVFTAAVVLFNHVLTYKRDRALIDGHCKQALVKIGQVITDPLLKDPEALSALLLCECRILWKNSTCWEFAAKSLSPHFKSNHDQLKARIPNKEVKESVNDVLLLVLVE